MSDERTCENCDYPASDLAEYDEYNYDVRPIGKIKYTLCGICSSTFLSRAITNARQYSQQATLFQSLGWIANRLLDEIRATNHIRNGEGE